MAKRKYSLLTLAICMILFVSILLLCGCNFFPSNNSETEYKLTVQDPNGYVIETLQESYKAGDEVTVKTKMLSDVVMVAYLDGVSLGLETQKYDGKEYHLEFYFEMPSHSAVLSFNLSDGWAKEGIALDVATQIEIVSSFVNAHSQDRYPITEDEISLRCFGAFDGVYVLFVDVESWGYTAAIEVDVIAGVKFIYSSGQKMYVYCNNAFYTILEAYENNILSCDNLLATQETYKAYTEFLYSENDGNEKDLPEGLTKDGIALDDATQIEIKSAFYNTYKDKYPDLAFEQLSLRCYGAFYTLLEAYENNILSYDNLLATQQIYKACCGSIYDYEPRQL